MRLTRKEACRTIADRTGLPHHIVVEVMRRYHQRLVWRLHHLGACKFWAIGSVGIHVESLSDSPDGYRLVGRWAWRPRKAPCQKAPKWKNKGRKPSELKRRVRW